MALPLSEERRATVALPVAAYGADLEATKPPSRRHQVPGALERPAGTQVCDRDHQG